MACGMQLSSLRKEGSQGSTSHGSWPGQICDRFRALVAGGQLTAGPEKWGWHQLLRDPVRYSWKHVHAGGTHCQLLVYLETLWMLCSVSLSFAGAQVYRGHLNAESEGAWKDCRHQGISRMISSSTHRRSTILASENEITFQQRYLINLEHWGGAEKKSPIFLYCGNEGDIEWFAVNTGFMWDIAPQFGALLLFPEHRYYGESLPYGTRQAAYNGSESLAFLTAEQAIADYVTLVTDLKKNLSAEACPVVLFGGSYGGMLAAWFRLKYPHIAIGALASSAPILQFEDLSQTDAFYRIVSEDFKRESISCFKVIQESWAVIAAINTKEGLHNLSTKFHMCRDLQAAGYLRNWLEEAYLELGEVNYPTPSDFLAPLPAFPIREVCKAIDSLPQGSDILSRLYAGANIYYNYSGNVDCFDTAHSNPYLGYDGWSWQACTEMVFPASSNANNSMFPSFPWDYASYEQSCFQFYGVKPRPNWVVSEFGGRDIKAVLKHFGSNIIFYNGLLDPWSGGGVLQNISSSIVALVAPEGAHHLDLRGATRYDPEWLVNLRESEQALIRQWLNEYYQDRL